MYALCWMHRVFNLNLRIPVYLNHTVITWILNSEHVSTIYIVFSAMKVLWQICTSAPLLHHSAPHRFGLQSLNFVLLSSACHAILSSSRKMGDDRKKRSRSRSRDKKRKDRRVFWQPLWFSCFYMPMDFSLLKPPPKSFLALGFHTTATISSVIAAYCDF